MARNLKNFEYSTIFAIFIFLIATIFPGALIIYLFNSNLFFTLDFYKLTLICGAITFPILFFNLLIVLIYNYNINNIINERKDEKNSENDDNEDDEQFEQLMCYSGALTFPVVYIICIIKVFINFSIDAAFIIIISFELFYIFFSILSIRNNKRAYKLIFNKKIRK